MYHALMVSMVLLAFDWFTKWVAWTFSNMELVTIFPHFGFGRVDHHRSMWVAVGGVFCTAIIIYNVAKIGFGRIKTHSGSNAWLFGAIVIGCLGNTLELAINGYVTNPFIIYGDGIFIAFNITDVVMFSTVPVIVYRLALWHRARNGV